MAYGNIYSGNYYPLDGNEVPLRYGSNVASIGFAVDARTANQLQEINNKLNMGGKSIEVQGTFPNVLEAIPNEHLKEIRRVSKLTGNKLSFHGPLVEPSGFNNQQGGGRWEEANRLQAERQITNAVERSHELDPNGNIVVTLHASAQLPEMLQREMVKGEDGKMVEKTISMYIVDPRTGRVGPLKETPKFFEENIEGKKYQFSPKQDLEKQNKDAWDRELYQVAFSAYNAEARSEQIPEGIKQIQSKINSGEISREEVLKKQPELAQFLGPTGVREELFIRNAYDQFRDAYDSAYEAIKREVDNGNKVREGDLKKLQDFTRNIGTDKLKRIQEKGDPEIIKEIVNKGLNVLKELDEPPRIFQPFNDFVIDKSSDTFSNVAFNTYKKFKENSPIISIENPPAGQGISRAEDIKRLIEESRKKLSENLIEKQGLSKTEAQKVAEKMIGATWDVGHINMLRKYGYENKELAKQAEIIAPYLKHIHLSDNFGYEHTELPMGMGNVPLKEHFEKFGKKINEVQKVVETGDWWQHFKTPPVVDTYSAFGASLYSQGGAPNWTQAAAHYGGYFSGYGTMLPDQHFQMYGGGFSGLPTELGGQQQTRGSRATGGTPLA